MARALPTSLSPHICTLTSPDLDELLSSASLPPLPHLLQSFSPLSQVTTRTTALAPVQHGTFNLRFSELEEIERACAEDDDRRALRTLDWISARIQRKCAAWVAEKLDEETPQRRAPVVDARPDDAGAGAGLRVVDEGGRGGLDGHPDEGNGTPWWDELRACAEGLAVPSHEEGWNHPAAVILAVSTTGINPLQAVKTLHSRQSQLPSWVDPTHLRYTLIVHPRNSQLSDEVANALLNAVKREYGLHCYLLPLDLPTDPLPAPVPAPPLPPRLPSADSEDDIPPPSPASPTSVTEIAAEKVNEIFMDEGDIKETAKFMREFTVQSLIPWMERNVFEWNEAYASTRRLPSRLFSSTRRLFGSGYGASAANPSPSPAPSRSSTFSTGQNAPQGSGIPAGGSITNANGAAAGGAIGQQRRLAEFATVLGDIKLAVSVWEVLRKEGKGGSEILPLLLAPGPGVPLHAQYALSQGAPQDGEQHPRAALRAITFAVRWVVGIDSQEFMGNVLEGDRWLVWAAANAEEAPSALLLAHAAHLSARKHLHRRAALWYLIAANRLEKCGIKPLTMHFLRRAEASYQFKLEKGLSPSFWDADDRTPEQWVGFESIRPGIEAALGRLLYTTGDIDNAVRVFLRLLKPSGEIRSINAFFPVSSAVEAKHTHQVILEDFNVAFQHFLSIDGDRKKLGDLKLPISFGVSRQSRVRIPRGSAPEDADVWASREEEWAAYWRPQGSERLAPSGKASVNDPFWFDLVVYNPLDVDVKLANLSLRVCEVGSENLSETVDYARVEVIEEITLDAHETRTIPIAVTVHQRASLNITHATYDFLGLLPCADSLAVRGRRLHDTAIQRQSKTYAPDVLIRVDVEDVPHRLLVDYVDDGPLYLAQGETRELQLRLANEGTSEISEMWMLAGSDILVWIQSQHDEDADLVRNADIPEVLRSKNSLYPSEPRKIPLGEGSSLTPGGEAMLSIVLNAPRATADASLYLLFVYREVNGDTFYSVRLKRSYSIEPLVALSASARPGRTAEHTFTLNVEVNHVGESNAVNLSRISILSPSWECRSLTEQNLSDLQARQTSRFVFCIASWDEGNGKSETEQFALSRIRDVLQGRQLSEEGPPPIDLLCSHITRSGTPDLTPSDLHFMHGSRRIVQAAQNASVHPLIPRHTHAQIFPLYHPRALDVFVHWSMPSQSRTGIALASLDVGAGHGALRELIDAGDGAGSSTRSMYAETQREKEEMVHGLSASGWNALMDPVVVYAKDGGMDHDFENGPCIVAVSFMVRNCSLTHSVRYVFKLLSTPTHTHPSELLAPTFVGRQTFRGTLTPGATALVHARMSAARPGVYRLNQWSIDTEVGELGDGEWSVRDRFQSSARREDAGCVRVVDVRCR